MSHVEGYPDRDGLDKLIKLGKAICRTVQLFTPILKGKYPDNPLIDGLLIAINNVCLLLPEIETTFLIDTGTNEDPLEDPDGIPGIDPSLPPAPEIIS